MKLEYKLNIDDRKYIQTIESGTKYRIEIPNGFDEYGNRKRKVERVNGSFDLALKRRNEILEELNSGKTDVNKTMTLSELCDFFLETHQPQYILKDDKYVKSRNSLSYNTLRTYETYINNFLKVAIGNVRICDITPQLLDNMYLALEKNYTTKKGNHLSPCTMGHIHSTIRAILNFAKKKGLLEINSATNLENPPTVKCPEKECYNSEQLKIILNDNITVSKFVKNPVFYQKRFRAFTRVLIYGCLRRSEVSGLNWDDMIEEDYALKINRSASTIKGKGLTLLETKNESSEDVIVVGIDTMNTLIEYKKEVQLLFGEEITESGKPIFISQNGLRLAPQALNDIWNNYISTKKDILPQYTLHTLRHSGGTFLYNLTNDLKGTSKHLRHSSIETTANIYLHSDIKHQKELVGLMQTNLQNEVPEVNISNEILEAMVKQFVKEYGKKVESFS